jgi:hypothetical protein
MFHPKPISILQITCLHLCIFLLPASAIEWDTIIRLTVDPNEQRPGLGYQRSLAIDPTGNIWVFWQDSRNSFPQLWYRRFEVASRIWLPESQLTRMDITCNLPSVASDGQGNIHVCWHIDAEKIPRLRGIWYQRFNARTGQWQPETLLVPAPIPYWLKYPSVAVEPNSGTLHIVYYGHPDTGGLPQVFHKQFVPGLGWLPAEQLTSFPDNHSDASVAVDSNDDLCVVWLGTDLGSSEQQVLARCRIGGVWQEIQQVSDLPGGLTQYSPAVAAGANGYWHIVWSGQYPNHRYNQIFYRCRTPAGWSDIFTVSRFVPYSQFSPCITTAGNQCVVIWTGKCPTSPETTQLQVAIRNHSGIWTEPIPITSFTLTQPHRPAIIYDPNSGLSICFSGDSAGNVDVYYLSGRLIPSGIQEHPLPPSVPSSLLFTPPVSGARIYSPAGMKINSLCAPGVYLIEDQPNGPRRFRKLLLLRGKN